MEHLTEILIAAGAGMQTVNLFLVSYLLKRVDGVSSDLVEHERSCIRKNT